MLLLCALRWFVYGTGWCVGLNHKIWSAYMSEFQSVPAPNHKDEQTGAERALDVAQGDAPPPHLEKRDVRATSKETGSYVKLPNEVALDTTLNPDGLALVAYRATFVGKYVLHRKTLKRIFDIGDTRFYAAINNAAAAGYLQRDRARDGSSSHGKIVETIKLPLIKSGYVFIRRVEMEALDLRALAAFLFVAARPTGQHAYGRELSERFGWVSSTSMKWLGKVIEAGLVTRVQRQRLNGQMDGCVYAITDNRGARPPVLLPNQPDTAMAATSTIGANDQMATPSYGGLADWLTSSHSRSGEMARNWRAAIVDAVEDERLSDMKSAMLTDDLLTATVHRVSPKLLSPDGLQGYRWLVCGWSELAALDLPAAHQYLLALLSNKIGEVPGEWINSWVYLVKSTFQALELEGHMPRHPGPIRYREDRRN
jgi:hypothetical protein